jgi:hypothetical protein
MYCNEPTYDCLELFNAKADASGGIISRKVEAAQHIGVINDEKKHSPQL